VLDYKTLRWNDGVSEYGQETMRQDEIMEKRIKGIFIYVGYRHEIDGPIFWSSVIAISGGIQRPTHPPTNPIQIIRYSSMGQENASIASVV